MKRILFSLLFLVGCSSVPKQGVENIGVETVLSRIDDRSSRPDWLTESEPFKIEKQNVLSLGLANIPGDHRVEAAYRIAENNAKSAIAGAIEQRLEFLFQNAEEGSSMDATQARFIGAEASKLTTNSLRISKRYWEKYSVVDESGRLQVRYRVYSQVSMPENDFKSAVIDAVRKAQGKGGLSQDFAKKVDNHWNAFVNEEKPIVQAQKDE